MKKIKQSLLGLTIVVVMVFFGIRCLSATEVSGVIQDVPVGDYNLDTIGEEGRVIDVKSEINEEEVSVNPKIKTKKSYAKKKKYTKEHKKLEPEIIAETNNICKLIAERGMLYQEQEVLRYVNSVATRIAEHSDLENSGNIKVKIVRDPLVNAFAMANGVIHVHTGALASLKSEAQLAFLLAHEISHVAGKDVIFSTKSSHDKIIAYKLFDIVLSPTAVFFGIFGDLAQIGFNMLHVATITGYSRNIEARADRDAISWTSEQGYNSFEAAAMLDIFLKEKDKYCRGSEIYFLMSHPSNKWRQEQLKKVISKKYGDMVSGEINQLRFLMNMVKIKLYNAQLNIKMDRLLHAQDNVSWVLEKFPDNPLAHFIAGEICRLKAEDTDKVKGELNAKEWSKLTKEIGTEELKILWIDTARNEYKKSIQCDSSYPDAYKGLGLLSYNMDEKDPALAYFTKYLELSPEAKDRRYINFMIKRINKSKESK
ncbi:MAG: M48 family metallopeptidase [Candidatus Omnitrophota bacterium]|nr:M48 family metallopeptidase [Candidatus Omnitrophota bacterium]